MTESTISNSLAAKDLIRCPTPAHLHTCPPAHLHTCKLAHLHTCTPANPDSPEGGPRPGGSVPGADGHQGKVQEEGRRGEGGGQS